METKIKKLIADHVKRMRRSMSWTGENDYVVKKIMKIIKVGITGGMGCGKSSLLRHLDTFNWIHTIDLDKLAFRNYALNKWSLYNIKQSFGDQSIIKDEQDPQRIISINRENLSKNVFKSEDSLNSLKSIVSPSIKQLLMESFKEIEYKKKIGLNKDI